MNHPLRPTALEIASSRMYGEHREAEELARADDRRLTPLAALEQAVLPALQRHPCLVSFSGGRDSSSVLAVATCAARREGLPPPVPITLRFRNAPAAQESAWQEQVVRHLGLREWELREAGDDMDRLGPLSAAVLRRHGLLYSPNAFLQLPLLQAARGGSLLSGFGGDEVLGGWRWGHQADVLARRRRLTPYDARKVAYAASPVPVRRWREGRAADPGELSWLRPEAARAVAELAATARAEQPRSWARAVDWLLRRRQLCASRCTLALLAADAGTHLAHPLLDPSFLSALAITGGRLGFGDRTAVMRAVFSEALPDSVLSRPTKAHYEEVLWGKRSREFAASWDGSGVERDLVDPAALRREWLKREPHGGSVMLLLAAWLSEQTSGRSRSGRGGHVQPPRSSTGLE